MLIDIYLQFVECALHQLLRSKAVYPSCKPTLSPTPLMYVYDCICVNSSFRAAYGVWGGFVALYPRRGAGVHRQGAEERKAADGGGKIRLRYNAMSSYRIE